MPSSKHTSKTSRVLSSRSTSSIKHSKSGTQAQKHSSTSDANRDGASEKHQAALSWRDNLNQVPRLNEARARELTADILKDYDDDKIVMDLIELVTGIAYDPVAVDRDSLARASTYEAVRFAPAFSTVVSSFATNAAMRERQPTRIVMGERPVSSPVFAEGGSKLGRNAARAAGRLCADYTVTLKSATSAFEEEMIAETLRFYPKGGHEAALHLGITLGELGKLLRKIKRRQSNKNNSQQKGSKGSGPKEET